MLPFWFWICCLRVEHLASLPIELEQEMNIVTLKSSIYTLSLSFNIEQLLFSDERIRATWLSVASSTLMNTRLPTSLASYRLKIPIFPIPSFLIAIQILLSHHSIFFPHLRLVCLSQALKVKQKSCLMRKAISRLPQLCHINFIAVVRSFGGSWAPWWRRARFTFNIFISCFLLDSNDVLAEIQLAINLWTINLNICNVVVVCASYLRMILIAKCDVRWLFSNYSEGMYNCSPMTIGKSYWITCVGHVRKYFIRSWRSLQYTPNLENYDLWKACDWHSSKIIPTTMCTLYSSGLPESTGEGTHLMKWMRRISTFFFYHTWNRCPSLLSVLLHNIDRRFTSYNCLTTQAILTTENM